MLLTIAGEAATRPIKKTRSFIVVKSVVFGRELVSKGNRCEGLGCASCSAKWIGLKLYSGP